MAEAALSWLKKKVKYYWFIAPQYGMHAEQNWLTALAYFFRKDVHVSTDPSLHIHYLNLHEKNFTEEGGIYTVNGRLALLFHFSGFSASSNGRLTRYSNRQFTADTEKALIKIISEYEGLLLKEMSRFKDLHGDLRFCQDPLYKRMKRAEDFWRIKYFSFDIQAGFFERLGHKLDRLL